MTKPPPPLVERRAAGTAPRKPSKGGAALPPFDRRFQPGYPVADEPGLRFRQPTPAADTNEAASDVILVPVSRETIALATARFGDTDAADVVEAALRYYACRNDPAGVP